MASKKKNGPKILELINLIQHEKGIDKESIFAALEEGLARAYERVCNYEIDVNVIIDRETGDFNYYSLKTIVDEVHDKNTEISLKEVVKNGIEAEIDDQVQILIKNVKDLSRIAAQVSKQIFTQKLREEERNIVYNKYIDKKGDLMIGSIQRKAGSTYFIGIDNSKIDVVLAPRHQIMNEKIFYEDN